MNARFGPAWLAGTSGVRLILAPPAYGHGVPHHLVRVASFQFAAALFWRGSNSRYPRSTASLVCPFAMLGQLPHEQSNRFPALGHMAALG